MGPLDRDIKGFDKDRWQDLINQANPQKGVVSEEGLVKLANYAIEQQQQNSQFCNKHYLVVSKVISELKKIDLNKVKINANDLNNMIETLFYSLDFNKKKND